jgi:hypothetical protein
MEEAVPLLGVDAIARQLERAQRAWSLRRRGSRQRSADVVA